MVTPAELSLSDGWLRDRMDTLLGAPAELLLPERVLLYALVFALRPDRCLEIGTHFGGSTTIVSAALEDAGAGILVCVDPHPLVPPEVWSRVAKRTTLLAGTSPECLAEAMKVAGGPFGFAFIDGDHSRAGVARDIDGVLEVVAPGAYLLFHDAHYHEIREAIDEAVVTNAARVWDGGLLSRAATAAAGGGTDAPVQWGGVRMLRVRPESRTPEAQR